MRSVIYFIPYLLAVTACSTHVLTRKICTVESLNDPLVDDVPAITAALTKCGAGERIVLAENATYTIRSPLDLSPCKACDFQINGLVQVSQDWDYWEKHMAVFIISNASAIIIRSDGNTGIIDAQSLGLADSSTTLPTQIPLIFSISNESYQVHIRDLKIKNVPGTAFHITSGSSANTATTGYQVEQTQHVYVWNNTIRATGSCVAVLPNSTNIQLEQSTCITTSPSTTSSGIKLQLLVSTGFGWICNVFVRKVKAIGSMNVIASVASRGGGESQMIEITNATSAERALDLEQDAALLDVTQVTFKDFQGEARQQNSLTCANVEDVCNSKTENWNITISH